MLEYRVREGENNTSKKPAIILIHGYGSHADDLFAFTPYLPKNHTVIALQAPLELAFNSYAWYPLYTKEDGTLDSELEAAWGAVDLIKKNIALLIDKYHLNALDISLLGFSQGAILSWALAFSSPGSCRRIIALSGLIHESVDTSKKPSFLAYAAHGETDIIIPIEQARSTVLPVSKIYEEIEYFEFPDGHTVSQENFSKMLQWIEKTNL
jgi:phospholipase/carboxylesterase